MQRVSIIVLLVAALLGQLMVKSIIYVNFKVHQASIIKTLCIQKDAEVNT